MKDEIVTGKRLVAGYLGITLVPIGLATIFPLIMLIPFWEERALAPGFLIPGIAALVLGFILTGFIHKKKKGNLNKYQSAIVVTLAWLVAVLVSSVPFLIGGDYTFSQAMFESTSGWTTTGLSIVDVGKESHLILFHRSIMHFCGGVGLVLLMLCFMTDAYGMRLYYAEGHPNELLPNLFRSSRLIMRMYIFYIGLGAVLYIIFGMNWFDAINHSISAVATGGFSTKPTSIGYYDSFPIELISEGLMLAGATNFVATLYLAKGRVRNFFRYCEVQFTIGLIVVFVPLIAWMLHLFEGYSWPAGLRVSFFQAIAAFTTTGFQSVPEFAHWHGAIILPLILLMLAGGQSGSTAGGIKHYRVVILLKGMFWNIRDTFCSEHMVRANRIKKLDDDEFITEKQQNSIYTFIVLYLVIFVAGVMLLCGMGCELDDAAFEFSSAMGGVGLSRGITSPEAFPPILWVLDFGMFVGRLEIYVVLIAIIRVFKKL